jgi:alcohol dehydrogenase (NADP+)
MQRGIAVIPKSVNSARLLENINAVSVILDDNDLIQITGLERNLRMGKGAYCVFPDGVYSLKNIWEE